MSDHGSAVQTQYKVDTNFLFSFLSVKCLQCFDAVGWAAGRACGL